MSEDNPKIFKTMKKFVWCVALLFAAVTVSAQSAEEIQASLDRLAKLEKLSKPKDTGLAKVDELLLKSGEVATESMAISMGLHEANKLLSSEQVDDVAKINPDNLQLLLLGAQKMSTESLPAVVKLSPEAAKEVKEIKNPLKAKGALSAVNYSKTVVEVVTEETAFQVKALTDIIKKVGELKK